ncbi:GL18075 [Drosophila persimilis]|uniref:GL18075 n=1 Tax=Drosophila persimilis TaxID=7234 RepID=B4IS00_DROPE|nr:GL18075 [Drosophila persimilis]
MPLPMPLPMPLFLPLSLPHSTPCPCLNPQAGIVVFWTNVDFLCLQNDVANVDGDDLGLSGLWASEHHIASHRIVSNGHFFVFSFSWCFYFVFVFSRAEADAEAGPLPLLPPQKQRHVRCGKACYGRNCNCNHAAAVAVAGGGASQCLTISSAAREQLPPACLPALWTVLADWQTHS